jgi:hypothetical protein
MPIIQNQDPTESRLDDIKGKIEQPDDEVAEGEEAEAKPQFQDSDILSFLGEVKRRSRTYQQTVVMAMWENSEAAYRSEHSSRSKYQRDQYKNRAKYFKPKTRAAVRKNLTATANALFASQDVMSCEAHNDSDDLAVANAALLKELINVRLNNKTMKSGIPWFQIVLGARQQTQIMGICASKQDWTYKVVERPITVEREEPIEDGMGGYLIDQQTGQPMMQIIAEEGMEKDVVIDKPAVTLIPAEMVLIDPATDWINPAQASPTLIIQWPMHEDAVRDMMSEERNPTPWRTIDDEALRGAFYSESELMGLKSAREGNGATAQQSLGRSSSTLGMSSNIVEVWECFFRRDGHDYHCWSLKAQQLLSDPVPTEEVYPALRGLRPYVLGTDSLEAHVLYPQSPVDSWKQSQDEINDFANLRMDGTRQSVYPVAKVKTGRGIDHKAVQRRDQQGIILVREQEDVVFDRPTANTSGADREVQLLSNDFDDLAGIFSQSSVQSNRQIGDTVGGMQLIAANANATSEFDLRCFVETWYEQVLSQIVMLEQFYEDDATLLAIAGNKAKLFQKYGVSEITDEMLESQVQISVAAGIGSSDPMQKLIKFKSVMDIAGPFLAQAVQSGKAEINYEEIAQEIFGHAGYRNGAERFITFKDGDGQPEIPPEAVKQMMEALQAAKAENEQLKKDKSDVLQANIAREKMQQQGETQRAFMSHATDMKMQDDQQAHELLLAGIHSLGQTMVAQF